MRFPTLLLILALSSGCAPSYNPIPVRNDTPAVENQLVAISAYLDDLDANLLFAFPHADAVGQGFIQGAENDSKNDRKSVAAATTANAKTNADLQQANKEINQGKAAFDDLNGRWYVRWGQRLERWWHELVIAWLLAGAAAVVLVIFDAPMAVTIGTAILHFLPAANVFSWIIKLFKGGSAVAKVI